MTEECCALYEQRIRKIEQITTYGAKQLACDIEYLGSVLEELGYSTSTTLQQYTTLLRAPSDTYFALSNGCDPKLVTCVRQMRKIVSISNQ